MSPSGTRSQDDSLPSTYEWQSTTGAGSPRIPRWIEATNSQSSSRMPAPDSRSSTPTQVGEDAPNREKGKVLACQNDNSLRPEEPNHEQQVAQRSRWQVVLLEAGGLGAALSDENMRRLKYCLHCLQYATAQIDAQILILRDFIAGLQPLPPPASTSDPTRRSVSQAHMRTLTDVRRDLVHTVRQVVDVVSKYAGGALPEPARTRVRGFILKLPQRWASRAGVTPTINGSSNAEVGERESVTAAASGTGAIRRANRRAPYRERGAGAESSGFRSGTSSRAASPSSPRVARGSVSSAYGVERDGTQAVGVNGAAEAQVPAGTAVVAAQRILSLATESLDMMRGVTGVMKDSLDRADAWVNRLRTVGIQRSGSGNGAIPEDGAPEFDIPGNRHLARQTRHRHQRSGSSTVFSQSGDDDRESYSYSYFRGDAGLASPASVAGSVSGSSTAYSSYAMGGVGSLPSTPGGTYAPSPGGGSLLPLLPLGAMNLNGPGAVGGGGGGGGELNFSTPRSGVEVISEEVVVVDKMNGVERLGKEVRLVLPAKRRGKLESGLGLEDVEGERMDVDV
ncbi:hypothetical protein AX17_006822 [Amanita inopinata Kibby_2008]|nr:hypothetical protein AX17_006822 [Amanita inopinata Kibby_2008]